MGHSVLLLPGDGIGPEVVAQARRVLECVAALHGLTIELDEANLGGVAIDREGKAVLLEGGVFEMVSLAAHDLDPVDCAADAGSNDCLFVDSLGIHRRH